MSGLQVNRSLTIPLDEITMTYSTSGGPGGQHANRNATRATAVWNVENSEVLGPRQRDRLRGALRKRLDSSGNLRLSSDRYRSQLRNREDVLERLADLIADSLRPRKVRRPTTPTAGGRERRLEQKRHRAATKRDRRRPIDE